MTAAATGKGGGEEMMAAPTQTRPMKPTSRDGRWRGHVGQQNTR